VVGAGAGEHHVHRSGRGRRRHAGQTTFADLGFLEGGDFGNPSKRSERALRGLGIRQNEI